MNFKQTIDLLGFVVVLAILHNNECTDFQLIFFSAWYWFLTIFVEKFIINRLENTDERKSNH